jgi:hypothetical protein
MEGLIMPSKFKQHSELLALLDQRAKELGLNTPLPRDFVYRAPTWNAADLARIDRAVDLHAQAHRSDPFAAGRLRLHLTRGLDSSAEVIRAASSALAARALCND